MNYNNFRQFHPRPRANQNSPQNYPNNRGSYTNSNAYQYGQNPPNPNAPPNSFNPANNFPRHQNAHNPQNRYQGPTSNYQGSNLNYQNSNLHHQSSNFNQGAQNVNVNQGAQNENHDLNLSSNQHQQNFARSCSKVDQDVRQVAQNILSNAQKLSGGDVKTSNESKAYLKSPMDSPSYGNSPKTTLIPFKSPVDSFGAKNSPGSFGTSPNFHQNSPNLNLRQSPQNPMIKEEPNKRLIEAHQLYKLRPAFVKKFEDVEFKSIDFSECGNFTLCSSEKFIKIFKLDEPKPIALPDYTTRDGIGVTKFFKGFKLLHATAKNNVNFLDFEEGRYLIKFPASTNEITKISILGASDNHFACLSSNSVKFWDIRKSDKFYSRFQNDFNPLMVCSPVKREFAVAYKKVNFRYNVEIYEYHKDKAKKKFEIENMEDFEWTDLHYSGDGKMLMATTKNSVIVVIDAEDGAIMHELKGFENLYNLKIDACFTPCSKYIVSGSQNSVLHFWDLDESEKAFTLRNSKFGPIHKVVFNPQCFSLATAGEGNFVVWNLKV